MQSEKFQRFIRVACTLSRKDWDENKQPISIMATGLFIAAFLTAVDPGAPFAKGLTLGMVSCSGYLFGQGCFANERRLGALDMLLGLPISAGQLVLAKYASLFSTTFLVINIPGLIHHNWILLFRTNALALFIATVLMATTVVSDKPWAPQVPFWILMLVLGLPKRLPLHWLSSNIDAAAAMFLLLIPVIIYLSAWIFQRRLLA